MNNVKAVLEEKIERTFNSKTGKDIQLYAYALIMAGSLVYALTGDNFNPNYQAEAKPNVAQYQAEINK